mmetsp:Transcript_26478/g.84230  ORF Transcript_26478/g.84230 Transcript_26478/m.84230 type:complete len:300 (-) Transcript_26478:1082-1981(-)
MQRAPALGAPLLGARFHSRKVTLRSRLQRRGSLRWSKRWGSRARTRNSSMGTCKPSKGDSKRKDCSKRHAVANSSNSNSTRLSSRRSKRWSKMLPSIAASSLRGMAVRALQSLDKAFLRKCKAAQGFGKPARRKLQKPLTTMRHYRSSFPSRSTSAHQTWGSWDRLHWLPLRRPLAEAAHRAQHDRSARPNARLVDRPCAPLDVRQHAHLSLPLSEPVEPRSSVAMRLAAARPRHSTWRACANQPMRATTRTVPHHDTSCPSQRPVGQCRPSPPRTRCCRANLVRRTTSVPTQLAPTCR